jgi:hypothetical protein
MIDLSEIFLDSSPSAADYRRIFDRLLTRLFQVKPADAFQSDELAETLGFHHRRVRNDHFPPVVSRAQVTH